MRSRTPCSSAASRSQRGDSTMALVAPSRPCAASCATAVDTPSLKAKSSAQTMTGFA
jgi:hypothetical protein